MLKNCQKRNFDLAQKPVFFKNVCSVVFSQVPLSLLELVEKLDNNLDVLILELFNREAILLVRRDEVESEEFIPLG